MSPNSPNTLLSVDLDAGVPRVDRVERRTLWTMLIVVDFGSFGTFFGDCNWICCILNKSSDLQVSGTSPPCLALWCSVLMIETERIESNDGGSKSKTILPRCIRLDAAIQNAESIGQTTNVRSILWNGIGYPHRRWTSRSTTMGYVGRRSISTWSHRWSPMPRHQALLRHRTNRRCDNVGRNSGDR